MSPHATLSSGQVGRLRRARGDDAERIAAIYNQAIATRHSTMDTVPRTAGDMVAKVEGLGTREVMTVVEVSNNVLGWGIIKAYSDRPGYFHAAESSVYVDAAASGQGLGTAVMRDLFERARALDYSHLVAKILAINTSSVAFHERLGFEIVGVQRQIGLLGGIWHDVVIMQRLDRANSQ